MSKKAEPGKGIYAILKTREERGSPWRFGSREVGYAAAFGALGFAFKVLGIVIPTLPPVILEPRDITADMCGAFTGMAGSLIAGFIMSIPMAVPIHHLYTLKCLEFAFCYHYFRRPYNYIGVFIMMEIPNIGLHAWWFADIMGVLPFWAGYWAMFFGDGATFIPTVIILEVVRKYSPALKRLIDTPGYV